MSKGAVFQLAAYGTQDLYITGNPQVTHFKSVIKRHTNFSMELVENHVDGKAAFGQKLQCKLRRIGDLVHQIYIKIKLPKLQTFQGENNIYTSWVNAIGYSMINYVEIQIGDRVIDRHYGQWMNIWSELSTNASKKDALNSLVGKHNFFTSSTQNGPLELYIPLQFWFCKDIGSSLPLVALQHQDVRFNIQINSLENLWLSNDYGFASQIIPENIKFDEFVLLANYIFLDSDERKYFAKNKHFYLIEQVQQSTQSIDITRTENIIDLPFNHPVKELVWVVQSNEVKESKQWTNYSGDLIGLSLPEPTAPIKTAIIRFEGIERCELNSERYFRTVIPYKYHTSNPDNFIYVYSFSTNPEKLQPTGTANFSRIDTANLHITTNSNLKTSDINVYAVNYNIFRIINGISGILFAN
jgi:hypothetical protein